MAGNEPCGLIGTLVERGQIIDDLVKQAHGGRLLGFDKTCGEDHILDARRTDQRGNAADIRHRQAIAERARDRKPHPRSPGADAQVAARRDARASAGAGTVDGGNGRHPAGFENAKHAIDTVLIVERILRRLEGTELVDVGARGKRLVAGPPQQQHLDRLVAVGEFADLGEPLIHLECEGVARLRPVEGHPADAVITDGKQEVVLPHRYSLIHVARPFLN